MLKLSITCAIQFCLMCQTSVRVNSVLDYYTGGKSVTGTCIVLVGVSAQLKKVCDSSCCTSW